MEKKNLRTRINDTFGIDEKSVFYTKRRLIMLITAILLPLVALVCSECFSRGGMQEFINWVKDRPWVVAYNYLIYLGLFWLLQCLFNRLTISGTVFIAIIVIYTIVNINKYQASGLFFNPKDLKNQRNIGNFAELMIMYFPLGHFIFGLMAVIGTFALLFLLQNKYRMKRPARLIVAACGLGIMLMGCNTFEIAKKPINKTLRLSGLMAWEPNRNFLNNGMLSTFLGYMNVDSASQIKPENYGQAEVERIQGELEQLAAQPQQVNPEQPDKVIVILAESFMDVTRYEGVTYTMDPLADVREDLIGDAMAGVVAGTTANTEFELLTGMSMYPLDSSAVPYTNIYKAIPSLPRYFKGQGYSATALHTYYPDWYRRNEVYDYIGFDEFIGVEGFPQIKKGYYVSDETMADKIIEMTDNDEKQFIFAITMQNHSPYSEGKYKGQETPGLGLESMLSDEDETLLLNYVQGVYDSNMMYKKMKEHYEGRDENVVILFFGDHTPLFPNGGRLLADLGYYSSKSEVNSRVVPVALWSNYLEKPDKLDTPVSFNYLGSLLTEYCGMEQSPFLRYTSSLRSKMNVVTTGFLLDPDGEQYQREDDYVDIVLSDYFMMEYDVLYGSGYMDNSMFYDEE